MTVIIDIDGRVCACVCMGVCVYGEAGGYKIKLQQVFLGLSLISYKHGQTLYY